MNNKLLLIALLVTFSQAHGQCSINRAIVMGSNGVFTYRDSVGNAQLHRSETVGPGIKLTMHCREGEYQFTCKKDSFEPKLPFRCNHTLPPPTYMEVNSIGTPCKAKTYIIGRWIKQPFLELYRVCYDIENIRPYYSEVTLYPKTFDVKQPNIRFSTDRIPADVAKSFSTQEVFKTFIYLYGKRQTYIRSEKDLVIGRGHLTAAADFLFMDQIEGTMKYLNAAPQFMSINNGNWEFIERFVRTQIPGDSVLRVRTGTDGVLSLPKNNDLTKIEGAFLFGYKKNPVPKWFYKIVKNAKNEPLYVFLVYNNIYDKTPPPSSCRKIKCPVTVPHSGLLGYTVCCDPAHFKV